MPTVKPLRASKKLLVTAMSTPFLSITSGALLTSAFIAPAVSAQTQAQTFSFEIKSGSLASVLNQFASQSGIYISAAAELTQGKQGASLQGRYSAEQALTKLLKDSGLSYRFNGDNTLSLSKQQSTAAKPAALESVQLDAVQVTGELIARDLQDAHTSVAVTTGEMLEQQADADLYDVIERTPGIYSAFGEKGFAIRGIDQRGVGGAGNGLLVSTTVDGATISNSTQLTFFGPYSTWDLEQIEVLRGPQSTQSGRNALAGAVQIRSKDPIYEEEFKARVEVGQRNTRSTAFAANMPLVDDQVALRISAETQDTDGYVSNPTLGTDSYDAREQSTFRAALRFDPTDDLSAILKITHAENKGGEDYVESANYPSERVNFSNEEATEGTELTSTNLRIGYDINDSFRFESETTYFDADYERVEDFDFTAVDTGTAGRSADVENFQQEFKLNYIGEKLSGVVGLFYTDVSNVAPAGGTIPAEAFNSGFAGLGASITSRIDQNTQTENYALFGEAEYRITPQLGLIAGARYDHETIDFTSVNEFTSDNAVVASFLPAGTTETSSTSFNAFLPKVGVTYDVHDDLSFGLTVQRGYRGGGTSINLLTGNRNKFDPEYTWNYEASMRSQWFDKRLTVNANVFYTDWSDQQVTVLGSSGNSLDTDTMNAGNSRLFGGELEVKASPSHKWDLYASLALVNTKFEDFTSGSDNFTGNEFPFAPEFMAAAGVTRYFNNGMFVSADVSYADEAFGDAANSDALKLDERFLLNARVGYETGPWKVYAYARNLLDEDYITGAATDSAGNLERVRTGEPRTLGIVGQYHF